MRVLSTPSGQGTCTWGYFCRRLGLESFFLTGRWGVLFDENVLVIWTCEECGNRGIQADSMWKKLYAVQHFHKAMRMGDPLKGVPFLRSLLKAVEKFRPSGNRKKLALSVPMLKVARLMLVNEEEDFEDEDDFVTWVALFTMFCFMEPSAEALACLKGGKFDFKRVNKVRNCKFYLLGVLIERVAEYHLADELEMRFDVTKGDQEGLGEVRSVYATGLKDWCLVKDMAKLHQMRAHAGPDLPLFMWKRGSTRPGQGVRRNDIASLLKEAAEFCGIPKGRVATHSARRGGATEARRAGASMEHIRIFGRWRSDVFRDYVDEHSQVMKGVHRAMFVGTQVQDPDGGTDAAGPIRMREKEPYRRRQVVV